MPETKKDMSFRTSGGARANGREEKSYTTSIANQAWRLRFFAPAGQAHAGSRKKFLSVVRNDIPILAAYLVLFVFSACGNNKASSADTKQASAKPDSAAVSNKKTVLFFGDSLTAGYGLDDPADDSYPSIVQQKIDSAKLPYSIVNAGVSGETSAGGLARIDWVLKKKVDIFVLELGANDGLRGIPVEATTDNLQAIIDKVKAKYPGAKIVLAGMMVPPSMGADYSNSFRGMFPKIAAKNNIALIPFLLYNVAGNPKLNQKDGIHPTAAGAKIVAGNVWSVLKAQL